MKHAAAGSGRALIRRSAEGRRKPGKRRMSNGGSGYPPRGTVIRHAQEIMSEQARSAARTQPEPAIAEPVTEEPATTAVPRSRPGPGSGQARAAFSGELTTAGSGVVESRVAESGVAVTGPAQSVVPQSAVPRSSASESERGERRFWGRSSAWVRRAWPAQVPYALALSGLAWGLTLIRGGGPDVRGGTLVVGGVLLFAAIARMTLPGSRAGMLASRGRWLDTVFSAVLGAGVLVAALAVLPPG